MESNRCGFLKITTSRQTVLMLLSGSLEKRYQRSGARGQVASVPLPLASRHLVGFTGTMLPEFILSCGLSTTRRATRSNMVQECASSPVTPPSVRSEFTQEEDASVITSIMSTGEQTQHKNLSLLPCGGHLCVNERSSKRQYV